MKRSLIAGVRCSKDLKIQSDLLTGGHGRTKWELKSDLLKFELKWIRLVEIRTQDKVEHTALSKFLTRDQWDYHPDGHPKGRPLNQMAIEWL